MNVAKVNRATKGVLTAKRFKVERVPEFIFLRAGKYYRYNLKQYDVESFVGFATTWYNKGRVYYLKDFHDLQTFFITLSDARESNCPSFTI